MNKKLLIVLQGSLVEMSSGVPREFEFVLFNDLLVFGQRKLSSSDSNTITMRPSSTIGTFFCCVVFVHFLFKTSFNVYLTLCLRRKSKNERKKNECSTSQTVPELTQFTSIDFSQKLWKTSLSGF